MSENTLARDTNGNRVILDIMKALDFMTSWEDEGGAYHDDGWNQSWPDGYHG